MSSFDWDICHLPHAFGYSVALEMREKRLEYERSFLPKDGSPIPSIMVLNDDCLLQIFAKVSLEDLVLNVRACCSRFNQLADEATIKKCRDEEFVFSARNTKIPPIARRYGHCLKSLKIMEIAKPMSSILAPCTSLQNLSIVDVIEMDNFIVTAPSLVPVLKGLQSLSLKFSSHRVHALESTRRLETKDKLLYLMKACTKLKSIHISSTDVEFDEILEACAASESVEHIKLQLLQIIDLTPQVMVHARKLAKSTCLQSLNLCFVLSKNWSEFMDIFSGNRSLTDVYLLGTEFLNDRFLEVLDKCSHLKQCKINCHYHHDPYSLAQVRSKVKFYSVVHGEELKNHTGIYTTLKVTLVRD